MHSITVNNIDSVKAITLAHELKNRGLMLNVDFNFSYVPKGYDYSVGEYVPGSVFFEFYGPRSEEHAVYYSLRWL